MSGPRGHDEQQPAPEQVRDRLIGRAAEQERDEIRFWKTATEQQRGRTLYELLARGERIRASIPYTRQEPNRMLLRPGRIEIQPRE